MRSKREVQDQLAVVLTIIEKLEARTDLDQLETYVLEDQRAHRNILVTELNTINAELAPEEPELP